MNKNYNSEDMININKVYKMGSNSFNALEGINLCISKGEYVAIVGPSGAMSSS